jgi:hypothetical protein
MVEMEVSGPKMADRSGRTEGQVKATRATAPAGTATWYAHQEH